MSRARQVAALLTISCTLIALVATLEAVIRHEHARPRYEALVAHGVDAPSYDAARSDALYAEVEVSRADARLYGRSLAAAVFALLLVIHGRSRAERVASVLVDATRARATLALDLAVIAAGVAVSIGIAEGLGAAHAAAAESLAPVVVALFTGGVIASLGAGRSPGARALDLVVVDADDASPGALRAAAALALAGLLVPLLGRGLPWALSWVGLSARRR